MVTRIKSDEITGSDGGPVTFPAGIVNQGPVNTLAGTNLDITATDLDISSADTTISSAVTTISSADLNITAADFDVTSADTTISGAVTNISSADFNITSADLDITGADTTISSATTLLSGASITLSGPTNISGGLTVPTAAATGAVHSFTASLTLTAGTNVAAVVSPVTFTYSRLGSIVTAFGQVSIDPTADDAATDFTLSLPVARANFTSSAQGTGVCTVLNGEGGRCQATNGAQTITCNYIAGGTAVELVDVWFTYTL